jgi:hypothetical protein
VSSPSAPWVGLVVATLLAAAGHAQDGGARGHPLAGTWKFDPKASSDVSKLLAHFEANFLVRSLAGSVAPTNIITFKSDRMELKVESVINKHSTLVLDGATPTGDDMFGHAVSYTSTLEGEAVVSHGTVAGKDGKPEGLDMRRTVEPDGRMQLKMTITPTQGEAIEIRRVFNRVAP